MATINEIILPRVVELQKNAVAGCQAFPDTRKYATFPYFGNHALLAAVATISRFERRYVYNIEMTLHVGKVTEGYEQAIDAACYGYMESVTTYFELRPGLEPQPGDRWLDFIGDGGCSILRATAALVGTTDDPHKGVVFVLEVPLYRNLEV